MPYCLQLLHLALSRTLVRVPTQQPGPVPKALPARNFHRSARSALWKEWSRSVAATWAIGQDADMKSRLPLTSDTFADALRKGLGRAVLHVREHGDADVEEQLLEAVTRNLAYDPQSEGTRADWLVDILDLLPDAGRYTKAVAPAFGRASEDDTSNPWDVAHLAHLLRVLAERGDAAAGEAPCEPVRPACHLARSTLLGHSFCSSTG